MSYNTSDINKLKQQIKQYYSFIKNDGIILTNFAKYLLSKADMNIDNAIINLKEMSIKDIQNKLYDLTLELNTGNEISDIIKNKIDEENKKLIDIYKKTKEYVDLYQKYKNAIDIQINKTKKLEEEYELLKDTENKKLEDYKEKFQLLKDINEKELITIKDTIDGIYRNQIYDNEYTFEESKYIIKEPIIHLDVDKILEDIKNNCCDIKNICEDNLKFTCKNTYTYNHRNCNNCYYEYRQVHPLRCAYPTFINGNEIIKLNFPIEYKLNNNEYIIKIFQLNNNDTIDTKVKQIQTDFVSDNNGNISNNILIIYITNYGRIIKSHEIKFHNSLSTRSPSKYGITNYRTYEYVSFSGTIIYQNNKTTLKNCVDHLCNYDPYSYDHTCGVEEVMIITIGGVNNKIELIEQPKLNYRIPRLFINVIDAFHTQNTDLMQECCKKYLDITRESKIKDSILKDLELNNKLKEKDDIIKLKDIELEDKNKIIISQQEEINKLKEELMKFKKSLSNLIGE